MIHFRGRLYKRSVLVTRASVKTDNSNLFNKQNEGKFSCRIFTIILRHSVKALHEKICQFEFN